MSWVFFEEVLAALGHKLNYDAIVNYAGNSFCEKAWEMITENNPLSTSKNDGKGGSHGLAEMLNSGKIQIKGV